MAANKWLTNVRDAEKTCLIEDGKRKIHYKMPDESEMVEEYSMDTNVLLRRAWKIKHSLRGGERWDIEVGDPIAQVDPVETVGIKENSSAPNLTRRVTKTALEWRIRNLPYTLDTYIVTADPTEKSIVVRTSNKKYFKKIQVPELERVGLLPEQTSISFSHKFNTLIITYKKPVEVLDMERAVLAEILKVKPKESIGDIPPNCKVS